MDKILIIKLGALGDVVRTTPLLRVLSGDITWVTHLNAFQLLKNNPKIQSLKTLKNKKTILKNKYDLVLNLDEDFAACELATQTHKSELIGPYVSSKGREYTKSSAEWFDMSLISRYSRKIADQKKWENQKSYQEILFSMLGKKFKGEEYLLPPLSSSLANLEERSDVKGVVGLEIRAGERWMAKRWPHGNALIEQLKAHHIPFKKFVQSPSLLSFMKQIRQTQTVITTDSLALHLALGLNKQVIALFSCTSPQEIYGYGRMIKIVSPLLKKCYYSTKKTIAPGKAITAETVFKTLKQIYHE
jgi:heptosyltransferase-2